MAKPNLFQNEDGKWMAEVTCDPFSKRVRPASEEEIKSVIHEAAGSAKKKTKAKKAAASA